MAFSVLPRTHPPLLAPSWDLHVVTVRVAAIFALASTRSGTLLRTKLKFPPCADINVAPTDVPFAYIYRVRDARCAPRTNKRRAAFARDLPYASRVAGAANEAG